MSVSIDGLRPWEFWQMDSEEYDLIRELQSIYRHERDEERKAIRRATEDQSARQS
jgi:hypothetical protein